ncbi:MAG: gliding motility-associated C-terminal domain-containing protein [Chitinophagaceae bacterium]|nr:gliding motility-associated C-terminal domain-containing protein [Chitinophagaceae bacterium]
MKKFITSCFLFFAVCFSTQADHITGGEMYYTFSSISNGQYQYNFTLKFYMRCNSGRQFNNPAIVGIFDKSTGARVTNINAALSSTETLSISSNNPCITDPPTVCYEVGYYNFIVTLPPSAGGYSLAAQVNFRIAGINNLQPGYGLIGATYSAEIPGIADVIDGATNNSAKFTGSDLVIVCANNSFSYSFAAEDRDNDELRYFFCDAYQSTGGGGGAGGSVAPQPPPYPTVPYNNPTFSGSAPLGITVKINPNTGLITGIAPSSGIYVVTVCVQEIRNGKVIATQRKDIQINITSCSIAAASIPDEYMLCSDTRAINLVNSSTSPLITSYNWELTNAAGNIVFTSTLSSAAFTFPDTGTYQVKLSINRGQQCSDSAVSVARVYPGFVPQFNYTGICFNKPTQFSDASTSVYGTVNSWNWDFGEVTLVNDVSSQRNPVFTYPFMGNKNVSLIVSNTKGCIDTIVKNIGIVDKPPVSLAFRDTLICIPDAVQLNAQGSGNFRWSPLINMVNPNTATPTVSPLTTTTYHVELNDNGCINVDSVKVRVTDHVDLQAMNDTVICSGDTIRLRVVSDGLQYSWLPAQQFIDPSAKNALAFTSLNTNYEVTASIGSCSAKENIFVSTVPYPLANAGKDTMICYNTLAYLQGSTNGNSVKWQPSSSLSNSNILNPVASPVTSVTYTLFAYDTKGCPKPGTDDVTVTVLPPIYPFAGRDTAVVTGQPLQLQATGGIRYEWIPSTGLSATNISNPVVLFNNPSEGIFYRVNVYNEAGCAETAYLTVKVFAGGPVIYVPNAFTPNGDGRNDVIRPIAAGIQNMEYFRIYNRYGQMVFSTNINGRGWDGNINGQQQRPDTYVWVVKALDYLGKAYFIKGTVTLIR